MPSLRVFLVAALALFMPWTAGAQDRLGAERMMGDVLLQPEKPPGEPEKGSGKSWAILPQLGFGPDTGPLGGVKLTDRDISPAHMTLDFAGAVARQGQRDGDVSLLAPKWLGGWLTVLLEGHYRKDPAREFFGLGNNHVGPRALSLHDFQRAGGQFTLGLRPLKRLILAAAVGYDDVRVRGGRLQGGLPSTLAAFPGLPKLPGGWLMPLSASIVYDNREDVTRPTRGWRLMAKAQTVRGGPDIVFRRYLLNASYLHPLGSRRQVLGLRVAGDGVEGRPSQIPFFESSTLGGSDDLRGFFPERFQGRGRAMVNAEYRVKVADFDFFRIWQVRVDGVAFGDMGRVYLDRADLARPARDLRFSYGPGLRIALGDALVARLDAGFSKEEKGLIYLTFGHTF